MYYLKDLTKYLLERKLAMSDEMKNKLSSIGTISTLSKRLKKFIETEDFGDDFQYETISFDSNRPNLLLLIDKNGKERPIKLVKFLKSLDFEYKDYEIEQFINSFKKVKYDDLKIVEGDGIKKYYCGHKKERFYSCMANSQKFLEIYSKNPNQVKLLIRTDNNDVVLARALLWHLDNGKYALDRIYGLSDDKTYFYSYARDNNIEYSIPENSTVTLENKGEYEFYPYMDTLEYYNPSTGVLTNNNTEDEEYLILKNTDGSYSKGSLVYSEYLEEFINKDEAIYDSYREDWFLPDNMVQSFYDGEMYFEKDMKLIWLGNENFFNTIDNDYQYLHEHLDEDKYFCLDDEENIVVLIDSEYGIEPVNYNLDTKRISGIQDVYIDLRLSYGLEKVNINKDMFFYDIYTYDECVFEIHDFADCRYYPKSEYKSKLKKFKLKSPLLISNMILFDTVYVSNNMINYLNYFNEKGHTDFFYVAKNWQEPIEKINQFDKIANIYFPKPSSNYLNNVNDVKEIILSNENIIGHKTPDGFIQRVKELSTKTQLESGAYDELIKLIEYKILVFQTKDYLYMPICYKGKMFEYKIGSNISDMEIIDID